MIGFRGMKGFRRVTQLPCRQATALAALLASAAAACPVCGSDGGREVRAALFDGSFSVNVIAALAPAVAVVLAAAVVRYGATGPGGQS